MVKKIIILFSLIIALNSCTYFEHNLFIVGERNVTFNVKEFDITSKPLKSYKEKTYKENTHEIITEIHWIVFSNGIRYSEGIQYMKDNPEVFGEISLSLPLTSVSVYFMGIGRGSDVTRFVSMASNEANLTIIGGTREVFLKKVIIGDASVGAHDKNVKSILNKNVVVELDRITGGLQLNINDELHLIPKELKYISMEFDVPKGFYVSSKLTIGSEKQKFTYRIDDFENMPEMFIHTWPFFNSNVRIMAYDENEQEIISSLDTMCDIYENQKTILSGNLFGSSSGFQVSIDSDWGSDNIIDIK